jgi:hypothetical protein
MVFFIVTAKKTSNLTIYVAFRNLLQTKCHVYLTSVTPKGMLPTYNLRACLVIVEPTTGTAACGVSATMFAGIWPAAKNMRFLEFSFSETQEC